MKCMRWSVRYCLEDVFLTAAYTSHPLLSACSTRKDPMNPLAPVMSIDVVMLSAKIVNGKERAKESEFFSTFAV